MKRMIFVLISMLVLASMVLTACAPAAAPAPAEAPKEEAPAEAPKEEAPAEAPAAAPEKLTIAWIPKALNNPVFETGKVGAEMKAKELSEKGPVQVEILYTAPTKSDIAEQAAVMEGVISKKVSAIGVSCNEPKGCEDPINKAVDAGIPVMTWDSDSPDSKRFTYLGVDNKEGGMAAAELMKMALPEGGKVALLTGVPGAANLEARITGFKEGVEGTNIEVVDVVPCNDDIQKGVQVVEETMTKYPDLDGWFLVGLWPIFAGEGAMPKWEEATKAGMKSVAFDTLEVELDWVKNGMLYGLVGQKYFGWGYDTVQMIYDLIVNGKKFEPFTNSGMDIVTICNVDAMAEAWKTMDFTKPLPDWKCDKLGGAAMAAPAAGLVGDPDLTGKVEIFSWWTGGGEAAGLEAMLKVFSEKYPGVEFVNAAVAGGAGTNARAVLATRLQAGDAPDSWQAHAGQEIIGTYVAGGQIQPLNDLFEENGWLDVMPETLIPLISADGNIYSVPVNIHRANVLWYNPKVLADNSVEVPTSFEEWIAAMDALKAAGMDAPLAMGEQWTAMHLFETIMLSSLGAEDYNGIWNGTVDWGSPEVKTGIENFAKVLGYVNSDATSLSWQDASKLVIEGNAAFNVMGDWAEGYFKELKKEPKTDFGWMPVPGTQGSFQFLSDSFVLAVNAPDPAAATAWLTVCGSKEGQDAFNPVKGSIPARSDGDKSLYDVYLQSAMDDWAKDTITGSLTHGVVANDSWKAEINDALGLFLADMNVDTFQAGLVAACESSGPCGE